MTGCKHPSEARFGQYCAICERDDLRLKVARLEREKETLAEMLASKYDRQVPQRKCGLCTDEKPCNAARCPDDYHPWNEAAMEQASQESQDGPGPAGSRTAGGSDQNGGCESRQGHALSSDECKGMYDMACGECSRCVAQLAVAKESQDRLATQSSDDAMTRAADEATQNCGEYTHLCRKWFCKGWKAATGTEGKP
jgi:hypothetical protein